MRASRAVAAAALLCGACTTLGGAPGGQGGPRLPEDFVRITDYSELAAVAVGPRHVWAAATAGVIAYDFTFGRWDLPLAYEGVFGRDRITALAWDPAAGGLWLGTSGGDLYSTMLGLGFGRWQRTTTIGLAPVLEIVPYPRSGEVYVATTRGWLRLRAGSFIADPVPASEVPAEVLASVRGPEGDPLFDAVRGTLGLDPRLRRWRVTDVAAGERPGELWIATDGGGLAHHDARRLTTGWLPYGLPSRGAGAVALDDARIWFGGDANGPGAGVAVADRDLARWSQLTAEEGAPRGAVRDILIEGDAVWLAAGDGVFRLTRGDLEPGDPGPRARVERFTAADGLPSDRATALARASGAGVWAGTERGLVRLQGDGATRTTLLSGRAVHDLALRGDTLWIASDDGLFLIPSAAAAMPSLEAAPSGAGAPPRGRTVAVATSPSAVHAIAQGTLYTLRDGAWSGPRRDAAVSRLGRISALAARGDSLWVGGEAGVAMFDAAAAVWRDVAGAEELGGPVRTITPDPPYVWISTPAGAFRLRPRP